MSAVLPHPGVVALNHLLRGAPLALERLRRHAGRTVAFHVGPLRFAVTIQTTGEVAAAPSQELRDLDVRISPFLFPRVAAGDAAALRDIEMQGDAELAQEVSFLAHHLRWDAEDDIARAIGPIAARRLVGAARSVGGWGRDASLRMAQGAAEYWTEEEPMLASRLRIESFVREVAELRDAVDRLEKRIERLG